MKNLLLLFSLIAIGSTSCIGSGGSRTVSSCNQCQDNANFSAKEYCVEGDGSLYCANPCNPHADWECGVGFWCVPLTDQGTPYATSGVTRWVCMPERYYNNKGSVIRKGGDCATKKYKCTGEQSCLFDDSNPQNVIYYCASPCSTNSDCLTGCCTPDDEGNHFCAPEDYCKQNKPQGTVIRKGGDCATTKYKCTGDQACLFDDSNPSDVYYYCASPCSTNTDCTTNCCSPDDEGNYFCTPSTYCNK